MIVSPAIQTDFYKVGHAPMFPKGTVKMCNNLTPRKSRMPGVDSVVVFGIQYWLLEYVIKQWNEEFFLKRHREFTESTEISREKKDKIHATHKALVINNYKRLMDHTMGKDVVSTKHLENLWDLGYMPLKVKALPEGSICPIGVSILTYENTHPVGFFLPGYLETILSVTTWQPITSATTANEYKKNAVRWCMNTMGIGFEEACNMVMWSCHDFSMRGMTALEAACTSGGAHLLSFYGTDTIPAISFLEEYYGANVEKEIVGGSVPASEHSVQCMNYDFENQSDKAYLQHLMKVYPTGIVSAVLDGFNLWKGIETIGELKEEILARDGKLVVRPDSGNPVDIICGTQPFDNKEHYDSLDHSMKSPQVKGVIELLWDIFGGTINEAGFKVLDPHIGCIYGDSITLRRQEQIYKRLAAKGFASTNIVLGIGSMTYTGGEVEPGNQFWITRDLYGFAVKATYGEVFHSYESSAEWVGEGEGFIESKEIYKDPITDDGTKKSAKGLLFVDKTADGRLVLIDQVTREVEDSEHNQLKTVFLNGEIVKIQTLAEIRDRLKENLRKEFEDVESKNVKEVL